LRVFWATGFPTGLAVVGKKGDLTPWGGTKRPKDIKREVEGDSTREKFGPPDSYWGG